MATPGAETGAAEWQRLDTWLWCARLIRSRSACTALVQAGGFRVNRQPTDKPHARVRVGDVLTFPLGGAERGGIRVWRVLSLGRRRSTAVEARQLYEDLSASSA